MTGASPQKPKLTELLSFGFLAAPLAFAGLPLYIYVPDLYATEFQVSMAVIGLGLLVLRLIDAIQDPLIGSLSDRYSHHRTATLLVGMLLTLLGFYIVFTPLQGWAVWSLFVGFFLCTTGFSIVTINMQGLASLWHVPAKSITSVMATREAFGLVGVLAASVLPALFIQNYGMLPAFLKVAHIFAATAAVGFLLFYLWYKKAGFTTSTEAAPLALKTLWSRKTAKLFFAVYLLNSIATAIPATLLVFFVRDFLKAEAYLGLFLVVYFLSGAAAMPFWQRLSHKKSKVFAWGASMGLAALTFIWTVFLEPGSVVGFSLICLFSGVAVGANLVLPTSIAADYIRTQNHHKGANRYYALLNFLNKAALAFAAGGALPLLEILGYTPGSINQAYVVPYVYALLPCVLLLITLFYWRKLVRLEVA